jgi:polyferredoxin
MELFLRNKRSDKMKMTWKTILAALAYGIGVFGWIYTGVWQILKKPVRSVIVAQMAGHLSIGLLIGALIQGFLYLSLAGGIWCVGYMISEYLKEK